MVGDVLCKSLSGTLQTWHKKTLLGPQISADNCRNHGQEGAQDHVMLAATYEPQAHLLKIFKE